MACTTQRNPMTEAELAEIFRMKAAGKPGSYIAERLGRSVSTIETAYHRAKVRREAEALTTADYAAVIPCMNCQKPFSSPDRRRIRLCNRCRLLSISPYAC